MKIIIDEDNKQVNKKQKAKIQYSKLYMTLWQAFVMFWLSVYFVVDIIYYKAININNIVLALVTSIVATLIPYFAKSFFETKEEKTNEIYLNNKQQLEEALSDNNDESEVG